MKAQVVKQQEEGTEKQSELQFLQISEPFSLENGESLPELTIAYHTWGSLNKNGDNAIWIC
ncbi:MAG TPA: hypothetical protein VFL47_02965, partial [Flavisolibacter sp.]|nr:hypothetical protein [Flavisolibacter sp.]